MKIHNPIVVRAYARALEHLPFVELVDAALVLNKDPIPVFYDHHSQQLRAVVQYPIVAQVGAPYLVTVEKGRPKWSRDGLPSDWADLETHTMHVAFVSTLGDAFEPIRLSRANHPRFYRDFTYDQHAHGIDWQHPDWVHPCDRITKDAFIMMLLKGEVIEVREDLVKEIEIFREDEDLILNGTNMRYNKDKERHLA